jgi:diguanylate cyclase (GGDEF)-like protein/PAS domain S-box-containing protein
VRIQQGEDVDERQTDTARSAVERLRWVAMALALARVGLAQPPPVSRTAAIGTVLAMAAYNAIVTVARRRGRWAAPLALTALVLDFLACTVWVLLSADDPSSSAFAIYIFVAIEAAALYQMRGAALFAPGFATGFALLTWARHHYFGFPLDSGSLVFRSGIVLLVGVAVGAIATQSQRRRFELDRQAEALRASEQRFRTIVDTTSIGVSVADAQGRLISANPAYQELAGYTEAELTTMRIIDFTHPDDAGADMRLAQEVASGRRSHGQVEKRWIRKNGEVRWVRVNASHLPAAGGAPGRVVAIVEDISERRRAERELAESAGRLAAIAATDVLTGLPNRREFERLLALPQSRSFAILAIDVDNLKVVNDGYGHEAGDAALRAIATALRMAVRDGDVVARSGGDEFSALLPDTAPEAAVQVGDRLRRAMHGLALPHGQARISIGCATGPAMADAATVLIAADEALYRAKRNGRDRLEAAPAVNETGSQQVRWETLVPSLLREDGMVSVFQPIVGLRDGRVIGYEALGRPTDGPHDIGVEGLFAAADRIGEGRSLDWVCRRAALLGCRGLPASTALFLNVGVSVLLDPLHAVDQMLLLLRWAGREPAQVVLEITEREAVRDLERLRVVIMEYRSHGFRFALDDVGTGHSTFEVLSVATPEFIKIAGTLTRHAGEVGPRSAIRALVAFAASSGARVIAEEVENDTTASLMRHLGVDLAQGFMWGTPAAASTWPAEGDLTARG